MSTHIKQAEAMQSEHSTLLVVEDDDIDFANTLRSLKKMKLNNPVIRACDGQQALEMLEAGKIAEPFIILLDIQMPRMNGIEFLTKLRADSRYAHSVVFVFTTSQDERDLKASYQHNVAGYFLKDQIGDDFKKLADMLKSYWQIVHFPGREH